MKTNAAIVQEFEKLQRFAPGIDFSRPFAEIAEQIRKAESDFLLTHLNAKDELIREAYERGRKDEEQRVKKEIWAYHELDHEKTGFGLIYANTCKNAAMSIRDRLYNIPNEPAASTSEIPPNENTH